MTFLLIIACLALLSAWAACRWIKEDELTPPQNREARRQQFFDQLDVERTEEALDGWRRWAVEAEHELRRRRAARHSRNGGS